MKATNQTNPFTTPENNHVSGWYVVWPEGSGWVAIEMDVNGHKVDVVEQSSSDTHIAAGDQLAAVCQAIKDGDVDDSVPMDRCQAVVEAWDADADLGCCVVERILL